MIKVRYLYELKGQIGREEEEYNIGERGKVEDLWRNILERHPIEIESAGYVNPETKLPYVFDPEALSPKSLNILFHRQGLPGFRNIIWYDGIKTEVCDGDTVIISPPKCGCCV